MADAKRDNNRVTTLMGVNESDLSTPERVAVDSATNRLMVTAVITAGGAGGVQYTEGDTDASITGTAMLMEGAANTLLPVPGTTADGLLVNLGANNDVSVTGSVTADLGANNDVVLSPTTTDGLTIFRSIDLDESEEEIKGTAGQVYGMWFSNLATTTRFLKFYNATAANVTVGSTTPVITIALPGNTSDDISGVFSSTFGISFGTAITVAATTGVADADTGAPGANEVLLNVFYK